MSAGDGDGASPNPKPAGPCALIIFGAAGDLTRRLLFPSLYNLAREGLLSEQFAVIGVARAPLSRDEFLAQVPARHAGSGDRRGFRLAGLAASLRPTRISTSSPATSRLATELEDAD